MAAGCLITVSYTHLDVYKRQTNNHTIARSKYIQRGSIITSDGVTLALSLIHISCEYRKMCYEMAFDLISRHSSSQEKNQREATVSE